jgi:hypothetical protein
MALVESAGIVDTEAAIQNLAWAIIDLRSACAYVHRNSTMNRKGRLFERASKGP